MNDLCYDNAFRSYIGSGWEKTSVDPVTWKHATGPVLVVFADPHTHRTGHTWTLTPPGGGPTSSIGARDVQCVLAPNNLLSNPRRRA